MLRARDLVAEIDAVNAGVDQHVPLANQPPKTTNYRFWHHSIQSDTSALDALKIMARRGACALLVMHNDTLVGLVTEQDYARKVANQKLPCATTAVSSIMSPRPETVDANVSVEDCLSFANDRHVQYLGVTDGGEILGLISIADISRALVGHRERNIRHLTHYILAQSQAM